MDQQPAPSVPPPNVVSCRICGKLTRELVHCATCAAVLGELHHLTEKAWADFTGGPVVVITI